MFSHYSQMPTGTETLAALDRVLLSKVIQIRSRRAGGLKKVMKTETEEQ